MTAFTNHAHGTFSWMELATTDVATAKKFYGDLFGWTYDDRPAGPDMLYSMASLGGRLVGALYGMGREMAANVPTHWASYVTVNDVDAVAKTVAANGGKVVKEPFDVMDVGRMAVVHDPAGAMLCLWTAKKHHGAGVKSEPGALCWSELYTTNVDASGAFYARTLGWKPEAIDMGPMGVYTLFKAEGVENSVGGMMGMPEEMKGTPSHWLVYVQVEDCDAQLKKAEALGATTLVPATDIPELGRFAIVKDPTGGVFALYKNQH